MSDDNEIANFNTQAESYVRNRCVSHLYNKDIIVRKKWQIQYAIPVSCIYTTVVDGWWENGAVTFMKRKKKAN